MQKLKRRGFDLGPIPKQNDCSEGSDNKPIDGRNDWLKGMPIKLPGVCTTSITQHSTNISITESLVIGILEGHNAEDLLLQPPYSERLQHQFESLGAMYNEGDQQEVETVLFDEVAQNKPSAEDLWMKVSWLSFHDEDASIRFRFSFGVDLEEDVAADPHRQNAAAELANKVFPESDIITQNSQLLNLLNDVMRIEEPCFVERIIYFNAPNGGAYLHHDLERGHAGVVYAQISGATLWLAMPQHVLVDEIAHFLAQHPLPTLLNDEQHKALKMLANDTRFISPALNSFAHDGLICLINETPEFIQHVIAQGHYRILNAGDAMLLPQEDETLCCWHSVFCLGEEMGQALSFAIR